MFSLGHFKPLNTALGINSRILRRRLYSSVLPPSSTLLRIQLFVGLVTCARLYLQVPSIHGTEVGAERNVSKPKIR